jgi:diguanylate cyclase (GGDEF)-like protein
LRNVARSPFIDTQLSQSPFWFSFNVPKDVDRIPLMVEFPSRHAIEIECWNARTLQPLGSGSRHSTDGDISDIKAGFGLDLSAALKDSQVVCRSSAIGPARLSAMLWRSHDLQIAAQEFHRKSGLLDGGILVLAVFVLITAMINRNRLYLLFTAWLVVNLRMGALSAGWDTQWLGHTVPYDWLLQGRMVTIALYYVLTLSLFTSLFRDDFSRIGHAALVRFLQWTCFPVLILSTLLPSAAFLPIFWPCAGAGIVMLGYLLIRILRERRSAVALWYSASICITLLASFYEVLAAALGIKGLIGSVNSVTAALSSALLAALAIAAQMRQEHDQRLEIQAELEHTFSAMPIGLFTLDLHGKVLSANPALLAMLGPDVMTDEANLWQTYFADGAWTQLHEMVHRSGQDEMEVSGRRTLAFTASKRFLVKATLANDKIEGTLQDVTEKSKATEDLYFLAIHDSLTKVLNRRGIETEFDAAIKRFGASDTRMALAYLDLDRFKLINDLFGHRAGDDVLQQVCSRVVRMLSSESKFGRVGGDEFVIVFSDTPIALATLICQGILDNIGTQPYRVGDKAFYVRGSIGLIEVSASRQFNDAMSTADRACRQAKSSNSGRPMVYERNALAFKLHEAELKLIALLSTSAATDGLYLEMQPIMSLTAPHDSLNFEVLLRMRDTDGQLVRTDHLIAAGEASGRMGVIDRWVLSTTLAWLNKNIAQMKSTRFVCMNLSGASLNDEKFLQDVYTLLEQNLHLVGKLCLEITESVALHDLANTRRFVDKVRGYGAKVALDDFGAGYTSFSYLKEFTADLLKIDGSFIVNMNKHPANIAIVEAIVNLAKNLGMKVIAEWAEDNATVQTLTEIGVDYVQGFAIARSQHPDKLLTAASSASFIQNQELAQFALLIGKSNPSQVQANLFSKDPVINVH